MAVHVIVENAMEVVPRNVLGKVLGRGRVMIHDYCFLLLFGDITWRCRKRLTPTNASEPSPPKCGRSRHRSRTWLTSRSFPCSVEAQSHVAGQLKVLLGDMGCIPCHKELTWICLCLKSPVSELGHKMLNFWLLAALTRMG